MAFSGHVNSDGKVIWRDEIYLGNTRIKAQTSCPSNQSDQTESSEKSEQTKSVCVESKNYLQPQRWEHINLKGMNNLLYEDHGESSSSSSAPLSLPPAVENNTYIHGTHNSDSLYSWSDMYGSLKRQESQSNVVPSLELHSKTSTLDYLRELGGLKLHREPQVAYETWYASKQMQRQEELKRQKEKQEYKRQKENERKDLAKICYEKWLNDKARQATQQRLQNRVESTANQTAAATTVPSSGSLVRRNGAQTSKPVRNISEAEIRQEVQSWWHKKHEQQQRQRLEKQRNAQKKEWQDQRRKQVASTAWQKWMGNVYDKPKPVPMNQGIDSLRGTVSPIYINPVPWKTLKKTSEKH